MFWIFLDYFGMITYHSTIFISFISSHTTYLYPIIPLSKKKQTAAEQIQHSVPGTSP